MQVAKLHILCLRILGKSDFPRKSSCPQPRRLKICELVGQVCRQFGDSVEGKDYMDQIKDFADSRLIFGCVHCGEPLGETRDHVPPKCFLDKPYPENLSISRCCPECNNQLSRDEEYVVCLIECILAGSVEPNKLMRKSVAATLQRAKGLRLRLQNALRISNEGPVFEVETERLKRVLLKLAKGHAAYELSQPCHEDPAHFWFGPLSSLSHEVLDRFNEPHIQKMFGEVGSRNLQRMIVCEAKLAATENVQPKIARMLVNDWIEVQSGNYRFLAIDEGREVVIRLVIREYLACEVGWSHPI